ncbi:PTS system fructose-specific IIB component/fructose-specific PTS system IIB-like component [Lachnotalea glycerini]|jgi:fructose-specific phosphotransferase system IIB component|uniref:PTS sugar transporter subunit IIC n=1 Tax=Lachnotalea glycerini TaxID=1763509 RepID=A0A255ISQ8_9FIRM|nr:PTS fructose transporter subunit IIB [Lachnotalea glycerini]PXV88334.1 PTS system fructose-specific IIB component/fructose-specific PTS system IIB-like component [Lachnotalea glycerini]RDY27128.1 PTS sugar transporter subunit IIC [Lachnotalea glycerini]
MFIVCVTSCPVGIAHTYMAAANLEKAAKAFNIEVKVETQGAQGVENEITKEDIQRADGCIIASDVRIKNSQRFEPIPTLNVSVSEAVKDAKSIIAELKEAIE